MGGLFQINYMNQKMLDNLCKYKYQACPYSTFERVICNPFWVWFTEKLPMWLAPNMVTLIGVMFPVVACANYIWKDPSMT